MCSKLDGEAYLKTYYKGLAKYPENTCLMEFTVKASSLLKQNARVLELASGPALYTAIPVARVASTIVLSDISPELLAFSERWKDGQKNAFDWDPYIKVVLDMEKAHGITSGDSLEDRKTKLKAAMEFAIIDIQKPPSLKMSQPFDMVLSSYLGTSCAVSHANLLNIWKEAATYVRPGGDLVIVEVTDCAYYLAGTSKVYAYKIGYDEQVALVGELGYQIIAKEFFPADKDTKCGYSGFAMFHLKKPLA